MRMVFTLGWRGEVSGKMELQRKEHQPKCAGTIPNGAGQAHSVQQRTVSSPSAVQQNEFKIILRYPTEKLTSAFENSAADMKGSNLTPIQTDRGQQSYWFKTDLTPLQLKNELQFVKHQTGQAVDVRMDGNTFELRIPN